MSRVNGEQRLTLSNKEQRRFYEPLFLLYALDPIRGERTKAASLADEVEPSHGKLRRSFADGLAYVAAYQKGPDHVTAIALEKTPQGIAVWLAANSNIEPQVESFLKQVLFKLQQVAKNENLAERREAGDLASTFLQEDVIAFNAPKLGSYYKLIVNKYVPPCLDAIQTLMLQYDGENRAFAAKLRVLGSWLRDYFVGNAPALSQASEFSRIVHGCYRARKSHLFQTLHILSGQGQPRNREFEQLHKLLCKLGKVVVVSKRLIDAAVILSNYFVADVTIKILPSSRMQKMPLSSKETSITSIVGRMFSTGDEQKEFQSRLQSLRIEDDLSEVVKKERKRDTRVHAELLLINHFDQYPCNFLDPNDKYIGCSKPACYLCYNYIVNHSVNYAHPASHQKVYPVWRLPDILAEEPQTSKRLKERKRILSEITKTVRRDLTMEIESRTQRRLNHADSTAGLTSTMQSWIQDMESSIQGSIAFSTAEMEDSQVSTVLEISERDEPQFSSDYDDNNDEDNSDDDDDNDDDEGGVRL